MLKPNGNLLILHDLGRNEVNLIHQKLKSEVIRRDFLPSGSELAGMLLDESYEFF